MRLPIPRLFGGWGRRENLMPRLRAPTQQSNASMSGCRVKQSARAETTNWTLRLLGKERAPQCDSRTWQAP
eukprot:7292837-Alexandrium_andersonii.AAC.1